MSGYGDVVRADIRRCVSEQEMSTRRVVAAVWDKMGLQAVLVYRFGQLLRHSRRRMLLWPLRPLGWLMYACAVMVVRHGYGIRLSLRADVGAGFWVGHFGGIGDPGRVVLGGYDNTQILPHA
jgi:serine acetyltransferase